MLSRAISVLWVVLLWAGTILPAAGGTDPIDRQILALRSQGYTHFQITRRLLSAEIEAYAPFGSYMHLKLAKDSGEVLEINVQRISFAKYARAVDAIHALMVKQNPDEAEDSILSPLMQVLTPPPPPRPNVSGTASHGTDEEADMETGDDTKDGASEDHSASAQDGASGDASGHDSDTHDRDSGDSDDHD